MPVIISFALLLYFLLDVVLTDAASIRNLPKLVWLVLVVVLPLIGGLVWMIGGRPLSTSLAPGGGALRDQAAGRSASSRNHPSRSREVGGTHRRPRDPQRTSAPRPRGPDDDPAFLREVSDRLRREAQERDRQDPPGADGGVEPTT